MTRPKSASTRAHSTPTPCSPRSPETRNCSYPVCADFSRFVPTIRGTKTRHRQQAPGTLKHQLAKLKHVMHCNNMIIIKRPDLIAQGWSPWMIRRQIECGALVPVVPGQYVGEPSLEITVKYGSTFHHLGVHRTRVLEPVDILLVGSLRVTNRARTLSDLAAALSRDELEPSSLHFDQTNPPSRRVGTKTFSHGWLVSPDGNGPVTQI
jgi:hypothetical protein